MSAGAYYKSVSRKVRKQYSLRALRRRAFTRQKGLCFWCGVAMTFDLKDPRCLSADHYPIPQHLGGKTEPGNIVAACRTCNSERHPELDKPRDENCTWSAGDDLPASPFECLSKYLSSRK